MIDDDEKYRDPKTGRITDPIVLERRRATSLAEEAHQPISWFWLSFVEGKNLGVAIVEGRGILTATEQAWRLGINPGGEVLAMPCDAPAEQYRNRLLAPSEARVLVAELDGTLARDA